MTYLIEFDYCDSKHLRYLVNEIEINDECISFYYKGLLVGLDMYIEYSPLYDINYNMNYVKNLIIKFAGFTNYEDI